MEMQLLGALYNCGCKKQDLAMRVILDVEILSGGGPWVPHAWRDLRKVQAQLEEELDIVWLQGQGSYNLQNNVSLMDQLGLYCSFF